MDVVVERVAGLDVGKASVTVCVRVPGPGKARVGETRTYSTMSRQLAVMADWLCQCGVDLAAMESTATYWKPVFYCLEEHMDTWLLNAAHIKAVPGRKSDVRDAEWIARLVEHGLVTPSFVPPPAIRRLRNLTRYRVQLMGDRVREVTRVEKLLEDASIKLSAVVSNIAGTSAREMLGALVAGERDPAVMADLAYSKLRRKTPELIESLTGHFDDHHAVLIGSMLDRLRQVEASLAACDAQIITELAPWKHQYELLQTIPGIGPKTAAVFIAETGADMSRSPPPGIWPPGPGSRPRCTSRPAGPGRWARGRATSGCARRWSRPPDPRHGRRPPTSARSSATIRQGPPRQTHPSPNAVHPAIRRRQRQSPPAPGRTPPFGKLGLLHKQIRKRR